MDITSELALANEAAITSDCISLVANLFTILACTVQLVIGLLDLRHRLQNLNGKYSGGSYFKRQD